MYVVPDGVEAVSDSMFVRSKTTRSNNDMYILTSVVLPDSVKTVEAFYVTYRR
jgi:hypothetical protein